MFTHPDTLPTNLPPFSIIIYALGIHLDSDIAIAKLSCQDW